MKIAPILRAMRVTDWHSVLVHTGQHYDAQMSDAFFRDLELPTPEFHLGVGSGSHAEQTAKVMQAFEPVLTTVRPDWVVVVGDVNSTLACALVTSKLKHSLQTRLAHVEAGLRSGDWSMPEEVNRVLTDRLSDLLLLPSHDAREHLRREGIPEERIVFVGNVMIDTLRSQLPSALALGVPHRLGLAKHQYVVCTLHRPSNVDSPDTLAPILEALQEVNKRLPVVLPLHPRTRLNAERFGLADRLEGLTITEPLGYREMLSLTAQSAVVMTDSGGLQEETSSLGIPCVTLREQTERPVTVSHGTNRLAPWPLTCAGIQQSFVEALVRRDLAPNEAIDGWDGRAGERVVAALCAAGS
jgi:UDP-N-acetylglucosamine 2-epimerase (non-hydrolysing)